MFPGVIAKVLIKIFMHLGGPESDGSPDTFKRPYNPVIVNMKANLESDKARVMTNIFRTPITFANN